MADNVVANAGAGGATFATDQNSGDSVHHPITKLEWGPLDTFNLVDDATGKRVPVKVGEALPAGTNNIGDVDVLTVPAPLSTTGGGTEATALRVTVASDSTGVISVDDNGGSLTVDGTVSVSGTVTVDSELTTADLDTGAGTDTRAVVGLVGSASGGGALIPGSATDGLLVNLGANNDVTVTGTVAVTQSGTWDEIGINDSGNSITVDNPQLSVVGSGSEAAALRVTIANDSTGVVSVDDNGGSLTIDGTVSASNTAGDVASDGVDSGNPVKIGLQARTTDATAVANADRVNAIGDTLGKVVVLQGAVHDLHSNGTANYTTTTASDVIAAGGVGVRIAVTSILVTNAHATVGTKVEIRDGTSVKIVGFAVANGGGFALNGGGRPLFITTANTAVTARAVTTGADIDVSIGGYRIAN